MDILKPKDVVTKLKNSMNTLQKWDNNVKNIQN